MAKRPVDEMLYEAMEWADEVGDERAADRLAELVMHASELRRATVRERRKLANARRTDTEGGEDE